MINQELFLRFGAALLIGVLIGMQREYAYSTNKEGGLFAGAISNTAAKGVLVFSLGSRSLRRYIWPALIIMLTIGLAFAIFV